MSTGAEILVFIAATLGCALTLVLTWSIWRAAAPAMDQWAKGAVFLGVLVAPALAIAGADDTVAVAVIVGYALALCGFSIVRGARQNRRD